MSSWYVETLLKSRHTVRQSITTVHADIAESYYVSDWEDVDYRNLLTVEETLREMYHGNEFSAKEIPVLEFFVAGYNASEIGKELGMSRQTSAKLIRSICDKVVDKLGYDYSDEGYLTYMKDKYKLTDKQINMAHGFMHSNKRNNNLRSKVGKKSN